MELCLIASTHRSAIRQLGLSLLDSTFTFMNLMGQYHRTICRRLLDQRCNQSFNNQIFTRRFVSSQSLGRKGHSRKNLSGRSLGHQSPNKQIEHPVNTLLPLRILQIKLRRSTGARATVSLGGRHSFTSRAPPIYGVRKLTIPVLQAAIPVDYEERNVTRNSLHVGHVTA